MGRAWPLYLCVFGDLLGFTMILPSIQFRAESFTPEGWLIGAMLSTMFIVQVLVSGPWGMVSDRIGRKNVVVICTVLSALSMVVYGLASSILWLFISRALAGLGGANVSAASAYLTASTDESKRSTVLGRLSAFQTAGLVAGPAIGGFVSKHLGTSWVGWVGAAVSFGAALAVAIWLPKDAPRETPAVDKASKRSRWGVFADYPQVRTLVAIAVVAWFSLAMLEGTFGRLIKDNLGLNEQHFGWIFSYESLLQVTITGLALGWITKRVAEKNVLRVAYLLQGAGLALFPLAPNLLSLFAASTLYAPGGALANPTINVLVSRIVPESRHGELFGTLQSARSLGFILGPSIGGALFDHHHAAPYFFAGFVCIIACLMVSLVRLPTREPEPTPA